MSRTDKDKPYWVRTDWYRPVHNHCQHHDTPYDWQRFPNGPRQCDLPETPTYYSSASWRMRQNPCCHWEAEWPRLWRYPYTRGPRRDDRALGWWGPDRRLVRDQCRKAMQEYRGSGDMEIVVSTRHHNHSPSKGWWD